MSRCKNCNKKIGVCGIECKFCALNFCTRCIQLEIHKCNNIQDCVDLKKSAIEKSLKQKENRKVSIEYNYGNSY